jgi:hypothetical protein
MGRPSDLARHRRPPPPPPYHRSRSHVIVILSITTSAARNPEAALQVARSIFPDRANAAPPQPSRPQSPAPTPQACHPERSEGPCLDPAPPTIDETQLPITPVPPAKSTPNPVGHNPQPTSISTNPTPATAPHSAARGFFRRHPHNASTNPFGTNIYTRPGNF